MVENESDKGVQDLKQVLMLKQLPKGFIAALIPVSLALVPTIVYVIIFLYETGFAHYFAIPHDLIDVNISIILTVASAIILLVCGLGIILALILTDLDRHPLEMIRIGLKALIIFFALVYGTIAIYLAILNPHDRARIIIGTAAFLILIVITIKGLLSDKRRIKAYTSLLAAFAMIFLLFPLSFQLGITRAMNREAFIVAHTNPDMVVLRIYGDNMVCAPFDKEKKVLTGGIRLLKLGADPNLIFIREKIGPLRPKYGIYAKTKEDKPGEGEVKEK